MKVSDSEELLALQVKDITTIKSGNRLEVENAMHINSFRKVMEQVLHTDRCP